MIAMWFGIVMVGVGGIPPGTIVLTVGTAGRVRVVEAALFVAEVVRLVWCCGRAGLLAGFGVVGIEGIRLLTGTVAASPKSRGEAVRLVACHQVTKRWSKRHSGGGRHHLLGVPRGSW